MKKVIVVDIDNTCAATNLLLWRIFRVPKDVYPVKVGKEFFRSSAGKKIFTEAPPILPVLRFLRESAASGASLLYATGRPSCAWLITMAWLGENGFPFGDIFFEMSVEEKIKLAVQKKAAIIDDDPAVIRGAGRENLKIYSVRWPYNESERAKFLADWRGLLWVEIN